MSGDALAPIIIKRKKVTGGDGHHGGAWKVAYADFVTAMMAFFLLMWLLNATTENQRKGLADYFSPTIPMSRVSGGGDGSFWGDDLFAEQRLPQSGHGATLLQPTDHRQAKGEQGVMEVTEAVPATAAKNLQDAEDLLERLHARGGESMADLLSLRHVVSRVTDEGLVIDIFEEEGGRLFAAGGSEPTTLLRATLGAVSDVLALVTNDVAVNAHMRARPVVLASNPIWDISADRADAARQLLEATGLPARRVQRVTGFADRKPVDPDPMRLRNSRIEIVVLRDGI